VLMEWVVFFMGLFQLFSEYEAKGDQPKAIDALVKGIKQGEQFQTLLGVTGSGKTFVAASVIEKVQKPTLVISHNKTLAAQLCAEYKRFFPNNAVEYFVSYYDYYQPEAYIPQTDLYIAKDASINEEINKLRHSATRAIMEREDTIIVASVSCIYGLGNPSDYVSLGIALQQGTRIERNALLKKLVEIQYERNEFDFAPGRFRVRGNKIDVYPLYTEAAFRVELSSDVVTRLFEVDPLSGREIREKASLILYPAKHFLMPQETVEKSIKSITTELEERLEELNAEKRLLEATRLKQRTLYDVELLREIGYCPGIENYSMHFDGRKRGEKPWTLLDYFPKDFLMIIDESHVTIPQIRGMYGGDRARKENLVKHGFRLPSAFDNRPLTFNEFERHMTTVICTSATPGVYEYGKNAPIIEQIIRPTGLVDPKVIVKSTENQVDDLINEIKEREKLKERVLVTTLTKRMAEDLTEYLIENGIKAEYMHSEVKTLERIETLRRLRFGTIDTIVGINLLREGLDLPEVSLVAILDADKEGFLRNETALIQTMGRAARNIRGEVILYANNLTQSIKNAVEETNRRREIQRNYNKKHKIIPKTIEKSITDIIDRSTKIEEERVLLDGIPERDLPLMIIELEEAMKQSAQNLEFERAAILRDRIYALKKLRDTKHLP
jgi:excinuclease ABC subunit B